MTKAEIAESIIRETRGFSQEALRDVLNFINSIKFKQLDKFKTHTPAGNELENELQLLNKNSLTHLEEEFANYKERYPYE